MQHDFGHPVLPTGRDGYFLLTVQCGERTFEAKTVIEFEQPPEAYEAHAVREQMVGNQCAFNASDKVFVGGHIALILFQHGVKPFQFLIGRPQAARKENHQSCGIQERILHQSASTWVFIQASLLV